MQMCHLRITIKITLPFGSSLNNLLGAKNSPWYNYPTYGFQAMAGIKLKF
jgi:hypothetical protein